MSFLFKFSACKTSVTHNTLIGELEFFFLSLIDDHEIYQKSSFEIFFSARWWIKLIYNRCTELHIFSTDHQINNWITESWNELKCIMCWQNFIVLKPIYPAGQNKTFKLFKDKYYIPFSNILSLSANSWLRNFCWFRSLHLWGHCFFILKSRKYSLKIFFKILCFHNSISVNDITIFTSLQ